MPVTFHNEHTGEHLSRGTILKGVGGFYDVYLTDSKEIIICKLRGKLRLGEEGIIAGDYVEVSGNSDGQCMIEKIMARKNRLKRPKVANLDQAFLVLAARDPCPDWLLLDKMLVTALFNGIKPLICFNKCDLLDGPALDEISSVLNKYAKGGFTVIYASSKDLSGISPIYELLKDHISVLAGPSGVGKSSLLNALFPSLGLTVGEVSNRLKRGKHTTRHVEIWPLEHDILVADTPGFSLLDMPTELKAADLCKYYPEFDLEASCRFDGCLHDKEPDCAVKEAVENRIIDSERYLRYLKLLNELRDREEVYR